MLRAYMADQGGLQKIDVVGEAVVPADAVWLDLFEPTPQEERAAEAALGIDVPTREEMHEIEASSRLYEEKGALYMTASIVTRVDTGYPETTAVTFILARDRLATLRYADPVPFRTFVAYLEKHLVRGDRELARKLNVAVDAWGGAPVSEEQLLALYDEANARCEPGQMDHRGIWQPLYTDEAAGD